MTQESVKIGVGLDEYSDIFRTVEAICEGFPSKYWRDLEDAPLMERYPAAFVAELEQAGFLGAGVPEEYGGIGLPMGALARIVATIHAAGCDADTLAEQLVLSQLLVRHGSEALRSETLPRVAEGARIQSLAIWEPASGRDTTRIATRATRVEGGYAIDGTKRWVRFPDRSDLMLVVARTGEGPRDLSLFLVDLAASRDGLAVAPIPAMNNFGGTEVTFEGFVVPADSLVGDLNGGLACLKDWETVAGILAAAGAGGCSRFFTRKGVTYANERVVFGSPIGKYQGIQFPLAQTYVESQGASLLLDLAVALYEAGRDCHSEALIARHAGAQAAWDTADAAFTTHGGFAFAREYDVERKWREVRLMLNEAANALPRFAEEALGLSTH